MITTLVIDRARLNAGGQLLDASGCMCPVGFLCAAVGVPPQDLLGRGYPADSWSEVPTGFRTSGGKFGNAAKRVAMFHESDEPRAHKERLIRREFAQSGIEVTFVGEYPSEGETCAAR